MASLTMIKRTFYVVFMLLFVYIFLHMYGPGYLMEQKNLHGSLSTPNQDYEVVKTVFKQHSRFVFFAGLEGTGHHFWQSIWEGAAGDQLKQDTLLSDLLFNIAPPVSGSWLTNNFVEYATQSKLVVERMRHLDSTAPGIYLINTQLETGQFVGMLSYPNFGGGNKAVQMPDVLMLARAAEEAQIDFRVVLLTRNLWNIMASTTVNRKFESIYAEANILVTAAYVLASQLRRIDPKFSITADVYATGELLHASAVQSHIGLRDEVVGPFSERVVLTPDDPTSTALKPQFSGDYGQIFFDSLAPAVSMVRTPPPPLAPPAPAVVVPKRVTSGLVRFLYVVGLRGTGQGALRNLWSTLQAASPTFFLQDPTLSHTLFGPGSDTNPSLFTLSGTQARNQYVGLREAVVERIRALVGQHRVSQTPALYLLNGEEPMAGVYPMAAGGYTVPNLRLVSELVEEGGGDLRVLVSWRELGAVVTDPRNTPPPPPPPP